MRADSSLVTFIKESPNHYQGRRGNRVTEVTVHYADPGGSVEALGELFANPSRQASSTYGIGNDGSIGQYVQESDGPWTNGSQSNLAAITIECCNRPDGSLTDACWDALVRLVADICRRNGLTPTYKGGTNGERPVGDMGTLTMHRWYQSTDCPGPWLSRQFGRLEREARALSGNLIDVANVAALIHADMVTDPRNGYSQSPRWGGDHPDGTKRLTIDGRGYEYPLGSWDCSSSTIWAWRQALRHTPHEGALDGATYTGDMRKAFVGSGLFEAKYSPAKRGDLYLAEGKHVAMCQDGGGDGVFDYDCLSEFNRDENHAATGGQVGDQDGYESVVRGYYDDGWNTVLHYVGGHLMDVGHPVTGAPEMTVGGSDMECILKTAKNDRLWYFDGTKARHISPDQLAGLQAIAKAKKVPLSAVELTQAQIDALTRM